VTEDKTRKERRPRKEKEKAAAPSQADLLRELAGERYRLACGPDGRPYAVERAGPMLAMPLRGALGLRVALAAAYADRTGRVPSSGPISDAMAVLEGQARAAPPEPVGMRVAEHEGQIVLDLGDHSGRAVLLGPDGWRVVPRSPVLFRRTQVSRPLPAPDPAGGGMATLRELLNIDDDRWPLVLGWLIAALIPDIPHPVLFITGEHGTAKSSAMRMLLQLLNPGPTTVQAPPREPRAWTVLAGSSWIVGLDNISAIPGWLADALCRAVTGDAIIERALYTDDDVAVHTFRRVIALTSIEAGALAGDLADRLLPIELARIPETRRLEEAEIGPAYAALWPAALGDLCDLACRVLAIRPTVVLEAKPRMADFARVLAAVDVALGTKALATYTGLAVETADQVVEADPFAHAVRALVERVHTWRGTAGELLEAITDPQRPTPRHWPATPEGTGHRLIRATPSLRAIGIDVERRRDPRSRARLILLSLSSLPISEMELSEPFAPSETAGQTPRTVPQPGVEDLSALSATGREAPGQVSDRSVDDLSRPDTPSDLGVCEPRTVAPGADSLIGLSPDVCAAFSAYGTCQGCGIRGARDTATGRCRTCTTTTPERTTDQ
jgi:hypothetical protein